MGALQPWHLIVIVVIVLVIFGPGKLPQLGKALGDGLRDFKKATSEEPHARPTDVVAAELATGARPCPSCHQPVLVADRFCGACGARTQQIAA